MIRIFATELHNKFFVDKDQHDTGEFVSSKEGNNISIKYKDADFYIVHKLPYTEICDKDGNAFNDVDECLTYLEYEIEDREANDDLAKEIALYKMREKDGQRMSRNLMAELRLNSKTLGLPRNINKEIETKLIEVKNNLDRGWWVSAKEELDLVTVSGFLSQELWDRINDTITQYITDNY